MSRHLGLEAALRDKPSPIGDTPTEPPMAGPGGFDSGARQTIPTPKTLEQISREALAEAQRSRGRGAWR